MNLVELAKLSIKSINETPKDITPTICLIMPGAWRRSNKKKLVPNGKSPIGDIVQETSDGVWVIFDATDVLAWCIASSGGQIQVKQDGKVGVGAEEAVRRAREGK